jgi:hypothetical protein
LKSTLTMFSIAGSGPSPPRPTLFWFPL